MEAYFQKYTLLFSVSAAISSCIHCNAFECVVCGDAGALRGAGAVCAIAVATTTTTNKNK